MSTQITALAALAVALSGLFTLWRQMARDRAEEPKREADVAAVLTETALELVQSLGAQVEELQYEVKGQAERIKEQGQRIDQLVILVTSLEQENGILRRGASLLERQVEGLGEVPVFQVYVRNGESRTD